MTRTYDLIPMQKFSIGFDQLLDDMDRILNNGQQSNTYPPYNIVSISDDHFSIEIAVAGFTEEELDVTVENNQLIVSGNKAIEVTEEKSSRIYLYRGIGLRSFRRNFHLDRHIEVSGAKIENGPLIISLERIIPDELKARKIDIKS
jgi:molecular chaperone IbpA